MFATFIYASYFRSNIRSLWSYLIDIDIRDVSWFLEGDFNIIHFVDEKIGGTSLSFCGRNEFNECIQACGLIDIPYFGNRLSWCNGRLRGGRIWSRLDRV